MPYSANPVPVPFWPAQLVVCAMLVWGLMIFYPNVPMKTVPHVVPTPTWVSAEPIGQCDGQVETTRSSFTGHSSYFNYNTEDFTIAALLGDAQLTNDTLVMPTRGHEIQLSGYGREVKQIVRSVGFDSCLRRVKIRGKSNHVIMSFSNFDRYHLFNETSAPFQLCGVKYNRTHIDATNLQAGCEVAVVWERGPDKPFGFYTSSLLPAKWESISDSLAASMKITRPKDLPLFGAIVGTTVQ